MHSSNGNTTATNRVAPEAATKTHTDKVPVQLPNLFQSFLKDAPPVNPHYEEVRPESEQWLTR